MKKMLAILLALMMVLVSAAALAEDGNGTPATQPTGGNGNQTGKTINVSSLVEPTQAQTLVIPKNYTVTAPEGADLPPDTLTFTLTSKKVEDGPYTDATMPVVSMSAEAITGGAKKSYNVTINLPKYEKVGVFFYEFEEADNRVAGVTYIKNKITMRVTVIQDEVNNKLVIQAIALREEGVSGATKGEDGKVTYDLSKKIDSLENKYDAGTLSLEKEVTGNMGEYGKVWNFTIKLKAPANTTVYSKITAKTTGDDSAIVKIDGEAASGNEVAAGNDGWTNKTINVTLAHKGKIVFENIPAGVTYEITETEANQNGYTTTPTNAKGTIATGDPIQAKFVNNKKVDIDTGITLDSAVYMMIMALALAGFVALKIRRREEN